MCRRLCWTYASGVLAVLAARTDAMNPLSGLVVGDRPEPDVPEGWRLVHVKAAALNHHDLWSLRGVGLRPDELPRILGMDAAGVDEDGNPVVVHAVIADPDAGRGDEVNDPRRSLLSERYDGTFAEHLVVPARNLLPKPDALDDVEAACLPTAWLTAYRMLLRSGARPGDTILVQGAGGGVSTAAIVLAGAMGLRVWVATRDAERGRRAMDLGADAVFDRGERLPERVDAVLDSVGAATWGHSLRAVRPGGTVVVCGATSGDPSPVELNRIFYQQVRIVGVTMGSRDELAGLLAFCAARNIRPVIDRVLPLHQAIEGFAALEAGDVFGKIVFTVP